MRATVWSGEPEPVPWCESCSRFYNPNTVAPDGSCINCGAHIGEPTTVEDTKVPWHFWLLVAALVIYLSWRLFQLIVWLVT